MQNNTTLHGIRQYNTTQCNKTQYNTIQQYSTISVAEYFLCAQQCAKHLGYNGGAE